jgi:hypothetical protein
MYSIIVKDYENKKISIKDGLISYRSAVEKLFNIAYKYIHTKQGILLNEQNLIYNKNNFPDFRGKCINYIRRNINNIDKIYVIELIRQYGYIYNNFQINKKLKIEIYQSELENKSRIDFINNECDEVLEENNNNLLVELREYIKKNIDEEGNKIKEEKKEDNK